jgi:hypothetical protein
VLPSSFVVAAYIQVRLTPQDFGRPRKRDFAGPNLHLGIFEQSEKNDFFSKLLDFSGLDAGVQINKLYPGR